VQYVWYACYGSNLCRERFLCYIIGKQFAGNGKKYKGCRNHAYPVDDQPFIFSHPLYFAHHSSSWQGGGVAFIDHTPVQSETTLGRLYKITEEQFCDVAGQENGKATMDIDWDILNTTKSFEIETGWYGRVLYLGRKDNLPIVTVTAKRKMEEMPLNKPSQQYIDTIVAGLIETHGLSAQEACNYLENRFPVG